MTHSFQNFWNIHQITIFWLIDNFGAFIHHFETFDNSFSKVWRHRGSRGRLLGRLLRALVVARRDGRSLWRVEELWTWWSSLGLRSWRLVFFWWSWGSGSFGGGVERGGVCGCCWWGRRGDYRRKCWGDIFCRIFNRGWLCIAIFLEIISKYWSNEYLLNRRWPELKKSQSWEFLDGMSGLKLFERTEVGLLQGISKLKLPCVNVQHCQVKLVKVITYRSICKVKFRSLLLPYKFLRKLLIFCLMNPNYASKLYCSIFLSCISSRLSTLKCSIWISLNSKRYKMKFNGF